MAVVTRYVNPDADAGGDGTTNALTGANCAYKSLAIWNAAEAKDIVTATETHVCVCETGGTADTTAIDCTGWTTNATYFITIKTESGHRHGGTWNDAKFRLAPTNDASVIILREAYTVIEGLQAQFPNGTSAAYKNILAIATGAYIQVKKCIFRNNDSPSTGLRGILVTSYDDYELIQNNIFYAFDDYGITSSKASPCYIYNNTLYDCVVGITQTTGSATAINNAVFNNTTDINSVTTTNYNASDDGTGTNAVTITQSASDYAALVVNAPGGDFNVTDASSELYLASEITNADDANVPVDDIIGTARNTGAGEQTSIGAFEYVAGGPTFIPRREIGAGVGRGIWR